MLRPLRTFSASAVLRQCHRWQPLTLAQSSSNPSLLLAVRRPGPDFLRRQSLVVQGQPIASFHCTSSRQGLPSIIPLLASILKTSSALEIARTSARIALTFVPLILFKNHRSRKILQYGEKHAENETQWEETKIAEAQKLKSRTRHMRILISIPILLSAATIIAALERTPLTGRLRLILLSPEEEDQIAAQLAGPGWYQAINEILARDGPVRLTPASDWRYAWVETTLRQLEQTIPILQREHEMEPEWLNRGPNDVPLPPPAEYPLVPRPRAHEYLRMVAEMACQRTVQPAPHALLGPPYSLLIVDKPDALNAFSYGFGPHGGGGIVVYSGFLDNILSKTCTQSSPKPASWWSSLFGSFFSLSSPPSPQLHPTPTPEQTAELAILLAHELAHLILSHHLESLSAGGVVVPAVMSIIADVVRAILFPVTMILGPFVNDALAQIGKVSSSELARLGENCSSIKQEVEADVVSARLLAHAGFDPRHAISFWEHRKSCATVPQDDLAKDSPTIRQIMGSQHPIDEVRVEKLRAEISRWASERQVVLDSLRKNQETVKL